MRCDICKVKEIKKDQLKESTCSMCCLLVCGDCMDRDTKLCKYCRVMEENYY